MCNGYAADYANEETVQIPSEYVCPLTLEVFRDPLMSKYGHNFERKAILEWLGEGNQECPLTRNPLSPSMLIPNAALRLKVRSWQEENNLKIQCFGVDTDDSFVDAKLVVGTAQLSPTKPTKRRQRRVASGLSDNSVQQIARPARKWRLRVFSAVGGNR
mmetsp:Transcript_9157/g.16393  ORF Transcript_9157/g.16393 Transcript_9157/m.16393 type:complete len:159 (+) Transcript_9157:47-523(+)